MRRAKRIERTRSGAIGGRLAIGGGVVVVLAIAVMWLGGSGSDPKAPPAEPAAPTPTAPPQAAAPTAKAAMSADGIHRPQEDRTLTISRASMAEGVPVEIEFEIPTEEIGDQPMTVQIRSNRETHDIGVATIDRDTGMARVSIDPSMLPPGQHLLAVRVAQQSWNPNRRIAVTVTE